MANTSSIVLATCLGSVAVWALWYQLVLRPASKRLKDFGPRWLSKLLTEASAYIFETLMDLPYESNLEESQERLNRQLMLCWHPHGAFCGVCFMRGGKIFREQSLKFNRWYCCIADILFKIPGISEFITINNCRSVDKTTVTQVLKGGHTIALQPGGIYEQSRWTNSQEVAYFPRNLGFIQMALQHGVPIIPSYIFGENQLFDQNFITRFVNGIMFKLTGAGVVMTTGRWGIPGSLWPIKTPIYLFFGNAIEVGEPNPAPSDERMREVFGLYVKELRRIFDENADSRLPRHVAKKGLKIVWRGHENETF